MIKMSQHFVLTDRKSMTEFSKIKRGKHINFPLEPMFYVNSVYNAFKHFSCKFLIYNLKCIKDSEISLFDWVFSLKNLFVFAGHTSRYQAQKIELLK